MGNKNEPNPFQCHFRCIYGDTMYNTQVQTEQIQLPQEHKLFSPKSIMISQV